MRLILLVFLCIPLFLLAQEDELIVVTDTAPALSIKGDTTEKFISNDVDTAFREAREYAYDKEFDKSTEILNFYIKQYPKYYDLRTFLARTKLWQKEYQAADNILYGVLDDNPDEINAYRVLMLSQQYRGNHDSAIAIADQGLKLDATDEALLMHKSQSQLAIREYKESLETVNAVVAKNPNNNEAKKVKTFLLNQLINDGLAVGYGIDYITEDYEQGSQLRHNGLVQLGSFTKAGMLIGRVNWTSRLIDSISTAGAQAEIDFYPILGRKSYLFLNAAYSQSEFYPDYQLGAEFYHRITNSIEASLGAFYRYYGRQPIATLGGLDTVGRASTLTITSSLGYYWDDNYLQGRINALYDNSQVTWGSSYSALFRHFIDGSASFIQFSGQLGFTPDLRLVQIGGDRGLLKYYLTTASLGITYQKILTDKWYMRLSFTVSRVENRRNPTPAAGEEGLITYYNIISPFILIGYRF